MFKTLLPKDINSKYYYIIQKKKFARKGLGLWCFTPLSILLVEETGENHRPATSN
jgi:hypothetical protein